MEYSVLDEYLKRLEKNIHFAMEENLALHQAKISADDWGCLI